MMRAIVLSLVFAAATAAPANALLCQALVGCSCTVNADDISFTNVNPLSGAGAAQGDVHVDCTGVVDLAPSVDVRINKGTWGTISARQMRNGVGASLDYNIYANLAHTVLWGDGTGGSTIVTISGGLLSIGHWSASRTMYGLASPTTSTTPGSYSDTVVVRIDW